MSSKKKVITIAITTVALLVSSIGATQASQNSGSVDNQKVLVSVLAVLVTKGTITQSQSDSITVALSVAILAKDAADAAAKIAKDAAKALERTSKDAAKALKRAAKALENNGNHSAREALIALTLGIDVKALHERSKAGESLATMAVTVVKKDALIAALVLDQTKRIDAFLAAGKITVAQATALKAGLVVSVTAEVNAVGDKKGGHFKGDKIG